MKTKIIKKAALALGLVFGIGAISPIHTYQTIATPTIQNKPTIENLEIIENENTYDVSFEMKNRPSETIYLSHDNDAHNYIAVWNPGISLNEDIPKDKIDKGEIYYIWYEVKQSKLSNKINVEFDFSKATIPGTPINPEPPEPPELPNGETPENKTGPNIGAIIGGIVGGLAILSLIGIGIWYYLRHKNLNDLDALDGH